MAYKTPGVFVEEITTLAPSVVPSRPPFPPSSAIRSGRPPAPAAISDSFRRASSRCWSIRPSSAATSCRRRTKSCWMSRQATSWAPCRRETPAARSVNIASSTACATTTPTAAAPATSFPWAPMPMHRLLATPPHRPGLLGGLSRVEPVDDPTLLVFPDGVSLSVADMGSLQVAALAQCEKLQDRFVIMDLVSGRSTRLSEPRSHRELPPEHRHQQPQIRRRVLPLGPDDLRADGALSPIEPGDAGLGRDSQRHNR